MLLEDGDSLPTVENNQCDDALPIVINGVSESGTTVGASTEEMIPYCGTSITAPGVWYRVLGNGVPTEVRLNATSFDTKISVYEGNCQSLACIGSASQSAYQWDAEVGASYYILVSKSLKICMEECLKLTFFLLNLRSMGLEMRLELLTLSQSEKRWTKCSKASN